METDRFCNINISKILTDISEQYWNSYYWMQHSCLVQLLSIQNVKEINDFGKYICISNKLKHS